MLFLALLTQLSTRQAFAPLPFPGSGAEADRALARACPAWTSTARASLVKAEDSLEQVARDRPTDPHGWLGLGCVRARLAFIGSLAHSGLVMGTGESWAIGSSRAFLRGLTADSANLDPVGGLAALVLNQEPQGSPPTDVVDAINRAVALGDSNSAVLRVCSEVDLDQGLDSLAAACSGRALRAGVDSTWHELMLARVAFRRADTVGGLERFLASVGAAGDSLARELIAWQLQWFVSPEQMEIWDSLPDDDQVEWVRNQLLERDVRDGQPEGSRLAEQFKRFDYVWSNFRLSLRRGYEAAARQMPAMPPGLEPVNTDEAILASPYPGAVAARMWRDYQRWQTVIDDRGVVWMRYGAPTKRVVWSCPPPCPIVREAWRYDIGGRSWILSFENEAFSGTVEATRLVTGVLGSYFCDLDVRRCGLTERSKLNAMILENHPGEQPSPGMRAAMEELRRDDYAAIRLATTTDDNSVRGDKAIATEAHLHRLWDPATGAPIALATYAMRLGDLATAKADSVTAATVTFAIRQFVADSGSWSETNVTRHLSLPRGHGKDAEVTGFLVTPSSPAVTDWSVVASQPDRLGRSYHLGGEGLEPGPLMISDLVLGSAAQGVAWQSSGQRVVLAPLDAIDLHQPMTLYYQVRSTVPHAAANTTVVLYRVAGDTVSAAPALQVVFHGAIRRGLNEVDNTVDVSRLEKGTYRLQVRIYAGPAALTERSTTLELR